MPDPTTLHMSLRIRRLQPLRLLPLLPLLFCGCGRDRQNTPVVVDDLFTANAAPPQAARQDDWTAALSPREFSFPADHAAHEDYRIEWWYYTGNLEAEDGSRFGYQLTFFRTGLSKQPDNPSKWAVRDLYTAHFAVSDIDNRQHHCFQRNNRQGVGQAGAKTLRYEVWNGDWKVWLDGDTHRLQAGESDVRIDLSLAPAKPLVLHGERGLSQKGPQAGNASHYYSFTRLLSEGAIRIGRRTYAIHGDSWMDHEFSTSFLEPGQLGWDWFAIQLDDGVDLMLYRMRREGAATDPFSSGSWILPSGERRPLSATDFLMTPQRDWVSAETRAVYPLHWLIEIPSLNCRLTVRPAFERQEMTTSDTTGINYWEGAIEVAGDVGAREVAGRGYMELTGYAGRGLGEVLE